MATESNTIYLGPRSVQRFESGSPEWFKQLAESDGLNRSPSDFGLDHPRKFKNVALFASYGTYGENLLELLAACKSRELEVDIGGRSYYSPDTFRIAIFRAEDAEQFAEYTRVVRTLPTETQQSGAAKGCPVSEQKFGIRAGF